MYISYTFILFTSHIYVCVYIYICVSQMVKNMPTTQSSNPGWGRSPEEGNDGYSLQYSCLENSMTEELGGL